MNTCETDLMRVCPCKFEDILTFRQKVHEQWRLPYSYPTLSWKLQMPVLVWEAYDHGNKI